MRLERLRRLHVLARERRSHALGLSRHHPAPREAGVRLKPARRFPSDRFTRWLMLAALSLGIWHNTTLLILWWLARDQGWKLLVDFNAAGEALLEGTLAHLSLLSLLAATAYLLKARK